LFQVALNFASTPATVIDPVPTPFDQIWYE
jgi:hypothetical protein